MTSAENGTTVVTLPIGKALDIAERLSGDQDHHVLLAVGRLLKAVSVNGGGDEALAQETTGCFVHTPVANTRGVGPNARPRPRHEVPRRAPATSIERSMRPLPAGNSRARRETFLTDTGIDATPPFLDRDGLGLR